MTAQPDTDAPLYLGDTCLRCERTEAKCAYEQGCCDGCTHTFSELNGRTYVCKDCNQTYLGGESGLVPERCPLCTFRATGAKPHWAKRSAKPLPSLWGVA